jgi:asparagine synthase (glutamine-hydrolysing)
MRGGFVACLGGDARSLDRLSDHLRWHRGPTAHRYGAPGFQGVAFADARDGPVVESRGGSTLLVHGSPPAPLADLQRTAARFAALEWDGETLRASRDPFGLVPLFYRMSEGAAWWSTEIGPLLALGRAEPDLEALAARAAGAPLDERTGWCGIHRVLPGSTVEISPSHFTRRSHPYWLAPRRVIGTYRGRRDEAAGELRHRLETAVRRCFERGSAVLLSGGLDSAAVAVSAPSNGAGPPHLVHVHFPSLPQTHEARYAASVATAVGAPLHTVDGDLAPWDIDAELDGHGIPYSWLPFGMDEPALAHLAAQGITVALDGHDGDGVLGPRSADWGALILEGALGRAATLGRRYGVGRAMRAAAADFLPPRLRPGAFADRLTDRAARYFSEPLRSRSLRANDPWRWPSRRWRAMQLLPLRPRATASFEQKEIEAARSGIDLRHPFADRELVEFLVSLPCAVKSDPGRAKSLLVDALRDVLPECLHDRPKSDYMAAVRARVDPARCIEGIRASPVRLPHVDYDRLFEDGRSHPDEVPLHLVVSLARMHRFAGRAR